MSDVSNGGDVPSTPKRREVAFSAHSLVGYPSARELELIEAMAEAQSSCPNGPDPESGELLLDPDRQDEPSEENALRAFETLTFPLKAKERKAIDAEFDEQIRVVP